MHLFSGDGASLGYQLASITAGGPAPIIATYVLAHYIRVDGGFAASILPSLLIALYIVFMSIVSLIAVQFLKRPIQEYIGALSAVLSAAIGTPIGKWLEQRLQRRATAFKAISSRKSCLTMLQVSF